MILQHKLAFQHAAAPSITAREPRLSLSQVISTRSSPSLRARSSVSRNNVLLWPCRRAEGRTS